MNMKGYTGRPRRVGKTYAHLIQMAGQPFYGPINSNFLYIGENTMTCNEMQHELMNILMGKGLSIYNISPYGFGYALHNQVFIFATFNEWYNITRGYKIHTGFIDVSNVRSHNLSQIRYKCKEIYYG